MDGLLILLLCLHHATDSLLLLLFLVYLNRLIDNLLDYLLRFIVFLPQHAEISQELESI